MQNTMNDIMNYIPVTLDQAKLLKDLGYNKKHFGIGTILKIFHMLQLD
jgi:hypothetical protein